MENRCGCQKLGGGYSHKGVSMSLLYLDLNSGYTNLHT